MAAYDGHIRIDTRVDTTGFNKGVSSMGASFGKVKTAIFAALAAIGALSVKVIKDSVDTASELSSAMIGLESVVSGSGRSFKRAKEFINEYISDGLVPATDAVAAYKNLVLRGYSTEEIEKILTIFKDTAAFGRQSQYTMGEAIRGATEGLKNENSILVDNVGVTKNVSKMWQDYAKSIGLTANQLTLEQKRQAEVNGIIEESRYQIGDAAKVANTYQGKLQQLSFAFTNLRTAIGNIFIPILQAIIPVIINVINAITALFNRVGMVVSVLFGVKFGQAGKEMAAVGTGAEQAAGGMSDLADATEKAGKAAKGALAPWDELNVLQQEAAEGGGAAPAAAAPIAAPITEPEQAEETSSALDGIKSKLAAIKGVFQPLVDAWNRFTASIQDFWTTVLGPIVNWLWTEVLAPIGKWIGEYLIKIISIALNMGALMIGIITELWNIIAPYLLPALNWIWENILKPVAGWLGQAILNVLDWINNGIIAMIDGLGEGGLKGMFMALYEYVSDSATKLWDGIMRIWGIVASWFSENVIEPVKGFFEEGTNKIAEFFEKLFGSVKAIWSTVSGWFSYYVTGPIVQLFNLGLENIKGYFSDALQGVKNIWSGIVDWFTSTIINPLKDRFSTGLNGIKSIWENTFSGIKDFVKNIINSIIGFLNSMARAIANAINFLIDSLNSLPEAELPKILGGGTLGFHIRRVTAPQIPLLATGAVIPPNSAFMAVLGDQRSGRNLEAPEALLRQIVREELGSIEANVRLEFGGTLGALVRELKPYISKEDIRVGPSFVKGLAR